VPRAPDKYYQSLSTYGRTFARVVPTSRAEARAQVQEMQALGVTKLYVGDDGGPYGKAIAAAIKQDAAGKLTVVSSQAGADGVFYGSDSPAGAARFFEAAASGGQVKLFAPSALYDPGFVGELSPSVRKLYVSVPGFRTQDLTPSGSQFVSQFQTAHGHAPAPQAIFGYEAMSALLAVLREAGTGVGNRSTVVKDFFGLRNRESVLGSYSIDANGDTSIAPFLFGRRQGGKLVPFAQVQG
jgi:branched-chain amino acid transport system substrate-binding protein